MFNYFILFILLLVVVIIFFKWKCGRSFSGGRVSPSEPANEDLELQGSPLETKYNEMRSNNTNNTNNTNNDYFPQDSPEVFRKRKTHDDDTSSSSSSSSGSSSDSENEDTSRTGGPNITINKEVVIKL